MFYCIHSLSNCIGNIIISIKTVNIVQCGSVTAPRKIIDLDVVTVEGDNNTTSMSRDMKKTRQLLLELEALYGCLLKAEDIRNPLYQVNLEKLRDLKQKQRIRELEAAATPEQKQEILRLLREDDVPPVENPHEYILKVVNGLMQEEKYISYLSIRKGKVSFGVGFFFLSD